MAVLLLDRPPSNALAPALRAELLERLRAVSGDAGVAAVVLAGAGAGFSAGVDLGEFDGPPSEPWITALCAAIEDAPKPVVAALHGVALGAGFELALAAHARVARAGTRVSLPEVTLGLIPGGGATQRLPRLVGAQASAELMLSGRAVEVSDPRLARVFDRITEGDPVEAATRLALQMAQKGRWPRTRERRRGLSDFRAYQTSLAGLRARLPTGETAEADIVACLEAAQILPFEQGIAFEAARFSDRIAAPEARGIRHIFAAERRAASLPADLARKARPVETVAVAGTGAEAAELAELALSLGHKVQVLAGDWAGAEAVLGLVRAGQDRAVASGRLEPAERERHLAGLTALREARALDRADLVLDTGAPRFERPVSLKPGAVWALLGEAEEARAREVGAEGSCLPVRLRPRLRTARLIEVIATPETPPELVATVQRCFAKGGRSVVLSSGAAGFAGDALSAAIYAAALVMLAGGVAMDRIEEAGRAIGFETGPLAMIDAEGAYATLGRMRRVFERREAPLRPLRLLSDRIADARGVPDHALAFHQPAGQALEPAPDLAAWVSEWREDNPERAVDWPGVAPATALQAALVNAAARLIEARAVQRPSDPDLVMVKGFGFDRRRGGPLLQADLQGLLGAMRAMAVLREANPALWSPCPLLSEMVKNGRRFF